ncbi:MAG TPA: 6,7-dimethyl-8-ribityllumazine synthase, partial [Candidatus Methylomirabilis sp.]
MGRTWEGALVAKGLTFGIVVSRTNEFITARLLEGALDGLRRHGAEDDQIHVV